MPSDDVPGGQDETRADEASGALEVVVDLDPAAEPLGLRREPVQVDEVVGGAGAQDELVEVAHGRDRVGGGLAELGEERAQAHGDGLRGVDQGVDVVERGPEVDEGGVGVAHEVGELAHTGDGGGGALERACLSCERGQSRGVITGLEHRRGDHSVE